MRMCGSLGLYSSVQSGDCGGRARQLRAAPSEFGARSGSACRTSLEPVWGASEAFKLSEMCFIHTGIRPGITVRSSELPGKGGGDFHYDPNSNTWHELPKLPFGFIAGPKHVRTCGTSSCSG